MGNCVNTGNDNPGPIIICYIRLYCGVNKRDITMAMMPWKQCAVGGCPELVRGSSRCEKHGKQQRVAQAERRHNEPFYNTMAWQRKRDAYKTRHPLCEECLLKGMTRPADMVHHIIPVREGGAMFDWGNLKSICFACHGEEHK